MVADKAFEPQPHSQGAGGLNKIFGQLTLSVNNQNDD